jgi:hypothetical protein
MWFVADGRVAAMAMGVGCVRGGEGIMQCDTYGKVGCVRFCEGVSGACGENGGICEGPIGSCSFDIEGKVGDCGGGGL